MSLIVQCNIPDYGIYGLDADFYRSINSTVENYSFNGNPFPALKEPPRLIIFHYYDNSDYLQFIEQTKRDRPETPIILTSGQRDEKLTLWALRCRIWDIIKIPAEIPLLKEKIVEILEDKTGRKTSSIKGGGGEYRHFYCKTGVARDYIDQHFSDRIRVESLAILCHMSPTTFLRYFKKENGITVREYLKRKRLDHARRLLMLTPLSVKEIALSSGYSDISLFNRIFKNQVGSTPSEFRKSCSNDYLANT